MCWAASVLFPWRFACLGSPCYTISFPTSCAGREARVSWLDTWLLSPRRTLIFSSWVSHLSCWMVSSCLPPSFLPCFSTSGQDPWGALPSWLWRQEGFCRQLFPHRCQTKDEPFPSWNFALQLSPILSFPLLHFLMVVKSFGFFKNPFALYVSNHCCVSYCSYQLCLRQDLRISEIHHLKIICIKNTGTWKQWHVLATARMIYRWELQFGEINPESWRLNVKIVMSWFCSLYPIAPRVPVGYPFHINKMQLCNILYHIWHAWQF